MYVCPPLGMLAFIASQTKDRDKLSHIKVEFPQSNKDAFT